MVSQMLTHKHHSMIVIHRCYEDAKIILRAVLFTY